MRDAATPRLRGDQARRTTRLLKGETERKRIGIPYLGDIV
jgi:hypothetical protein